MLAHAYALERSPQSGNILRRPLDHFYSAVDTTTASEREDSATGRLVSQMILRESRQSLNTFPHVRDAN
jgi:hypothetical protein